MSTSFLLSTNRQVLIKVLFLVPLLLSWTLEAATQLDWLCVQLLLTLQGQNKLIKADDCN